jgi:hypothetical protein
MRRIPRFCCLFALIAGVCATSQVKAGPILWNAAINASNPSTWYGFEETSGATTADVTPVTSTGYDGAQDGTYKTNGVTSLTQVTRGISGLIGNAAQFNFTSPSGGHLQATSVPLTASFSVEVIGKSVPTQWAAFGLLGSANDGANGAGFILHTNGPATSSTSAYIYNGAQTFTGKTVTTTTPDSFHHYVLTYDNPSNMVTLYLDGTPTTTSALAGGSHLGSAGLTVDIAHQFGQGFAANRVGNVVVDEWVLYNRALSSTEINSHFASITAIDVPEPTSFLLMALVIPVLGLRRRRMRLPV